MPEATDIVTAYMEYGATGLCVLMFIGIIITYFSMIGPRLKKLEENSLVVTEVIRQNNQVQSTSNDIIQETQKVLKENQKVIENNTQAFLNFSDTMQHFAGFMSSQNDKLNTIQDTVQDISKDTIRLTERAKQ